MCGWNKWFSLYGPLKKEVRKTHPVEMTASLSSLHPCLYYPSWHEKGFSCLLSLSRNHERPSPSFPEVAVLLSCLHTSQGHPQRSRSNHFHDWDTSSWAEHHWLTPAMLATWETGIRRTMVQGKQFARPHLQNNQSKLDWRRGSSSREPALQVWSPEFKPQSPHQR
jgi:hypothetical protein